MHGGDIYTRKIEYDFSVNINPLGYPAEVLEYIKKCLEKADDYPDIFQKRARERVAVLEGVDEDEIICGNGASELIMAVIRAVNPKNALIVSPGFYGYIHALHAAGIKEKKASGSGESGESAELLDNRAYYQEYLLREESGFCIQEDILEYIDSVDMLFLANPNNPTGRNIDPEILERILQRAKEKKCAVLLDECFLRLSDNVKSFKSSVNEYSNLYVVDAFTKIFALPGIRSGYLISKKDNIEKVRRQLPEWNLSTASEALLVAGAGELLNTDYADRSLELIRRERDYVKIELNKLGFKVYTSDTNFLLIRILMKENIDLYERLIQRKILIRDCSDFSGLGKGWYRIAVKKHEENAMLINEIKQILETL